MNPHLEFLLSTVYDEFLASDHQEDLEKSGLTNETIRRQLIRSVPPSMIRPLLGSGCVKVLEDGARIPLFSSAMLFPFRSPAGGFMDHVRVRIFPPFTDQKGNTTKYLQPKGSSPRLYFCAAQVTDVLEGTDPLWIVEGEKKALAVAQLGLPAIGICGIEGWHLGGSLELLPDFDAICLRGRIVELLPDGDVHTNQNVRRGADRFARALAARGATTRLVLLPETLDR